ncbi:MAG TPA: hypothetical protein VGP72_00500 [Planctomycetota bacterium]
MSADDSATNVAAAVPAILFRLLRQMDAEATTVKDGFPTGLNWYGGHVGTRQTEPQWSKRIVELLRAEGLVAECECGYGAGTRDRCDVVIMLPEVGKFWLEIKGAWKEYWREKGTNDLLYRSYLLHPLVPGLDKTKTHTVPLDLQKLARLTRADASYVGMLLVGFDSSEAPMDADVAQLVQLARLGIEPWTAVATGWLDTYRPGQRVRVWFWYRGVPQSGASASPCQ